MTQAPMSQFAQMLAHQLQDNPVAQAAAATSSALALNDEAARAITSRWGAAEEEEAPKRQYLTFQYWRKCTREYCRRHTDKYSGVNLEKGWIFFGPSLSDEIGHSRYIRVKHAEPLPQYGDYPTGEQSELATPATRFGPIVQKGGIYEFPPEQLIALGWDKIPVIAKMRPDIAGFQRIPCQYGCPRDFNSLEDVRTHIQAVHKEVTSQEVAGRNLKESMEVLTRGLVGQLAPQQSLDVNMVAQIVAATIMALDAQKQQGGAAGIPLTPVAADPALDAFAQQQAAEAVANGALDDEVRNEAARRLAQKRQQGGQQ